MKLTISEDLRKKYKVRRINVRKGDKVKIIKGEFKNHVGKISEVLPEKFIIEGVQIEKQDGTKANISIQKSNCILMELDLSDKMRRDKVA